MTYKTWKLTLQQNSPRIFFFLQMITPSVRGSYIHIIQLKKQIKNQPLPFFPLQQIYIHTPFTVYQQPHKNEIIMIIIKWKHMQQTRIFSLGLYNLLYIICYYYYCYIYIYKTTKKDIYVIKFFF